MDDPRQNVLNRRDLFRKNLNNVYVPFYDELCQKLDDTGDLFWAPTCGYRSLEDQDKLYAQGRGAPGKVVTNARAGDSAHNWAVATDFAYFGEGFSGQDIFDKADWSQYGYVIAAIPDLQWGGLWKFQDRPHNELKLRVGYGEVGAQYRLNGENEAIKFLLANVDNV